eukprot:scaffold9178_cov176-Amphora_coffeaeformis.AAC.15
MVHNSRTTLSPIQQPVQKTTMSSRRIIALTKEGISNLQGGRIINAVLSLRHAAECLKASHRNQSDFQEVVELNDSPLVNVPLLLDTTPISVASPHNAFDVYTSAFLQPTVGDIASFHSEVSIIIFYNLGLAHHLAATSGATDSAKHLQQALRCYKIALTVFQSKGRLHFDDWYSLLLGLLNNMGHIYCHSWQVKEAKTCCEHIDALLSSPDAETLSEEDGTFFFGAAFHSRSFTGVVAPAA